MKRQAVKAMPGTGSRVRPWNDSARRISGRDGDGNRDRQHRAGDRDRGNRS